MITIHNHPDGFPPSVDDFNSNYKNNYSLGVVCGHNGKIFMYKTNRNISYYFYESKIAKYKQLGYDEFNYRLQALKECEKQGNIMIKEVL